MDNDHSGYSGTGFANTANARGVSLRYSIALEGSGLVTLSVRYASTSDRPAQILANGIHVGDLAFAASGSWTSWVSESVTIPLLAGANRIHLEALSSAGLPNVDNLSVEGDDLVALACESRPMEQKADYVYCSSERENCVFPGTRIVRYGANGYYDYRVASDSVVCDNSVFSDPLSGVAKSCYYSSKGEQGSYVYCAAEHETCSFSGTRTVRYGIDGQYDYRSASGSIVCDNDNFDDPAYGSAKTCAYYSTAFVHPGVINTADEFSRMQEQVAGEAEPWASAYAALTASSLSALGKTPAPLEVLIRGGDDQNFGRVINELKNAYALALRWKVSGDSDYAESAIDFLNAWSGTLTGISGTSDRYLASGLYGYQFANIGELMSTYSGWSAADRQQLSDMLLGIFYPMNHAFINQHNDACTSHYWANWDLANIAAMMSIGIFTDRRDIFDEALNYFYAGAGNGSLDNLLFYMHAGNMGQFQESGRDQGHSTLGVSLFGVIAKMAWNQGVDAFAYNNYQLLAISEYIAKYNLFEDVAYETYGPNCLSASSPQTVISAASRGSLRSSWELIYHHYQNTLGLAAPWSEQMMEAVRPELPGNGDEPGWGTLTEAQDPLAFSAAPRALVVRKKGAVAELSWWGARGAQSYRVKRALDEGGSFSVIATLNASDLLTYSDTDISASNTYYYQVTAVSSAGESAASNTEKVDGDTELLAHFSFDAVDGDTVYSSNNNLLRAQLHNGAELVTGKSGNAVSLDGVDDYVQISSGILSQLSDFSIVAWVYLDGANDSGRLFDFGGSDHHYMTFIPRSDTAQSCFKISKISYHAEQELCTAGIAQGQWVHLALSRYANSVVIYVDGEEVARNDNVTMQPFQLGQDSQNWLGRSQYAADSFLYGRVDELRIYRGSLSASQVAALASE